MTLYYKWLRKCFIDFQLWKALYCLLIIRPICFFIGQNAKSFSKCITFWHQLRVRVLFYSSDSFSRLHKHHVSAHLRRCAWRHQSSHWSTSLTPSAPLLLSRNQHQCSHISTSIHSNLIHPDISDSAHGARIQKISSRGHSLFLQRKKVRNITNVSI